MMAVMGILDNGPCAWTVTCAEDPRFNISGRAPTPLAAGMATTNELERKRQQLGVTKEVFDNLQFERDFVMVRGGG